MHYDEALRKWGASLLEEHVKASAKVSENYSEDDCVIAVDTVGVSFSFEEGTYYGGSQDMGGYADIAVNGYTVNGTYVRAEVGIDEISPSEFFRQVIVAAGGSITL